MIQALLTIDDIPSDNTCAIVDYLNGAGIGCPNRVQGAHQVQDFTKAVPRSGVILIGDFFVAGHWPCLFYRKGACLANRSNQNQFHYYHL